MCDDMNAHHTLGLLGEDGGRAREGYLVPTGATFADVCGLDEVGSLVVAGAPYGVLFWGSTLRDPSPRRCPVPLLWPRILGCEYIPHAVLDSSVALIVLLQNCGGCPTPRMEFVSRAEGGGAEERHAPACRMT